MVKKGCGTVVLILIIHWNNKFGYYSMFHFSFLNKHSIFGVGV